jgi:hypothetical protein
MIEVELPDGRIVEFPQGTSRETMEQALRQFSRQPQSGQWAQNMGQRTGYARSEGAQPQPAQDEWRRGTLAPIERNERTGSYRPAVPQIVMGMLDALKLPGDVARGDVPDMDPRVGFQNMSPDTLDRAANASAMMTPSTPAARINMSQPIAKPQQQAIRRFQRGLADDQIPLAQAQQQLDNIGPGAMAMDLGPNLQQKAGGVSSVPGPAQRTVVNAVRERSAGAGERLAGDVRNALGTGAPASTMIDDIVEAQKAAAGPLYDAVRSIPVEASGNMKFVLSTPMGQRAFREARRMAANDGYTGEALTVGLMDYTKRALDDIASSSSRSGANNTARQARDLARVLTRSVDEAVPAYAQAREAFAGPAAIREALELGTTVFSRKVPPDELRKAMQAMTASEKDALLQGARAAVEDAMGNAVNDALSVRNLLRVSYNRDKLKMLLGDDVVDDLMSAASREMRFGETTNTAIGNSVTAARQIGQMEAAPQMRPTQRPQGVIHGLFTAFDAVRNKIGGESQRKANEELAKILTAGRIPAEALARRDPWAGPRAVAPLAAARGVAVDRLSRKLPSSGGGGF